EGKDHTDHPDADRLQQRRLRSESSHLENAGSEVQHGIDTRELIKKSNKEGEQYRPQKFSRENGSGLFFTAARLQNLLIHPGYFFFGSIRVGFAENGQTSLQVLLPDHQPSWTFGQAVTQDGKTQGRNGFHTEQASPVVFTGAGQQRVGYEGDQNTEDNIELKHAREAATVRRRSNLGNKHRRCYRRNTDTEPANKTEKPKGIHLGSQC